MNGILLIQKYGGQQRRGRFLSTTISERGSTVTPIIIPTKNSLQSVNFYIVQGENGITLIDAGYNNAKSFSALEQTLHQQEKTIADIDQILLTHHHIDHVGLVDQIVQQTKVPVYAHEKAIPRLKRDEIFLTQRAEFYGNLYEEMGCGKESEPFVQRMEQRAKEMGHEAITATITPLSFEIFGFDVIETPGHAVDHVIFYDEKRRWLFAGDLLLSHTSTNALVEPDENMNRLPTLVQYRNSLQQCAELNAEVTFSGHQELIHNHTDLINTKLKRIDDKAAKFRNLISQGNTTAKDIAQSFYKKKFEAEFPLVMSEVIGHLDYLEENGKISSFLQAGVRHYKVI